jgi:hypothetical protein
VLCLFLGAVTGRKSQTVITGEFLVDDDAVRVGG